MTTKVRFNFWLDEEQREGLRVVKARDGVPESEQIRRAIDDWLEQKDIKKAERKRVAARTRP